MLSFLNLMEKAFLKELSNTENVTLKVANASEAISNVDISTYLKKS